MPCPAAGPPEVGRGGPGGANPSGSPEWSLKCIPTLRCLVTHAWFLFLSRESSIFKRQSSFLVAGTGDKHDSVEVCINCGRDGINTRMTTSARGRAAGLCPGEQERREGSPLWLRGTVARPSGIQGHLPRGLPKQWSGCHVFCEPQKTLPVFSSPR